MSKDEIFVDPNKIEVVTKWKRQERSPRYEVSWDWQATIEGLSRTSLE